MVGNWAAAANRQHQLRATLLQAERQEWSNTDLLLLPSVYTGAGGQGGSGALTSHPSAAQTHT